MAIQPGSMTRVAFVPELAYGTVPATPSFKTMRRTGGNLRTTKSTQASNEIRADRNVPDLMQLGQDVTGSYDFEFTYGGLFDDVLAAALYGAWSSDSLKNGNVVAPFTVEETIGTGSGSEAYSRFSGVQVSQLSLSVQAKQPVTGTVNLMGRLEATGAAAVTGATYAAASTTPVSTASANVAALSLGGGIPSPKVKSLSLTVNQNLRTREVVGDLYSLQFGLGVCEVTGTMDLYFEDNTAYALALAHGGGALSFTIGNGANQKYSFVVPKFIFGDPQRNTGNATSDAMVTMPFQGVLDSVSGATITIARNVT